MRFRFVNYNKCTNFVITFRIDIMEVTVIKIGNSRGIRLSKTLLERYNIRDTVDLILEKGQIIIKPLSRPRKGWEKAFMEMNANGDDKLLINDIFEDENFEEWK
jgi:antitoxin MazE